MYPSNIKQHHFLRLNIKVVRPLVVKSSNSSQFFTNFVSYFLRIYAICDQSAMTTKYDVVRSIHHTPSSLHSMVRSLKFSAAEAEAANRLGGGGAAPAQKSNTKL